MISIAPPDFVPAARVTAIFPGSFFAGAIWMAARASVKYCSAVE